MLGVDMYNTIESLYKSGLNKSEIARDTRRDWRTVDKIIKHVQKGEYPKKKPHPSQLAHYEETILNYLESNLSGVRIHELLQSQGCTLSYSSIKNYIKKLKGQTKICIRFHTLPGEEAQVDFGDIGRLVDEKGKLRRAWIFNMRLSYSRLDFYKIVFDQKVETFIECHQAAFNYFGGIPALVKIDNLKAAVLEANFYQPVFQTYYKQFAEHCGFLIVPCRVRQPQEKGKVESGVKYVKNNFFAGRTFETFNVAERELRHWLDSYCNARIHGTTRKVPRELFESKERLALKKLPEKPFKTLQVGERKVYKDCHVYCDYNYYSVPFKYVGETVEVYRDSKTVKICFEGQQIALHARLSSHGQFSTDGSHYPQYKQVFSSENQQRMSAKMQHIGKHALRLFTVLLEKQPHHWYNTTQGILSLQKRFDNSVIDLACARALAYGAIQYQKIKSICESGGYLLPISEEERVH